MYAKNGCELLFAIRHSFKHYAVRYKAGEGEGHNSSCNSGLSLREGQLKKLWELKLLGPHGSSGMKIDFFYLIFTRILGRNNMGGEKKCAPLDFTKNHKL